MVAATHQLADARSRHLRVFLSQIHRHLACHHQLVGAALALHGCRRHAEVVAHRLQDVVNRQRLVVHLHGTLHHALSQHHVNLAVVHHAKCHQRVHGTLQVAHAAVRRVGDEFHHVLRNLQAVASDLAVQDVHAQLAVGLLQLCYQSARETRQQTVGHTLQVHRRTVARQDNPACVAEQVVEDVEERLLRTLLAHPFLHVVHDEQVYRLVEVHEVVERVLPYRVRVLYLKQPCTHVEHTLLRVQLLHLVADGIHQMRLATARRTVDEQRVELRRLRILRDALAHAARQLVAVALYECREGHLAVQLRIQFLRHHRVQHRRTLVGPTLRLHSHLGLLALEALRQTMLAVGHHTVGQPHAVTERPAQHLAQQVYVVLLQVLVHKRARHLNKHRLRRFRKRLEDDGLEPRVILLLGHVFADQRKRVLPLSVLVFFHSRCQSLYFVRALPVKVFHHCNTARRYTFLL